MAEYKHGAYGTSQAAGTKAAVESQQVMVYVGTAPVHTVEGGKNNVNRPIVVNNIAEARKYFGYSEEWDKYTLCEAMHAHLELKGVGPLVLINVLDPEKHKVAEAGTVNLTPESGRVTIVNAESIILDSVSIEGKAKGTDYTVQYSFSKKTITVAEITPGALGTAALAITYNSIDAEAVTEEDVIGSSDGAGLNTGLYAMKNIYQLTGCVPSHLTVPGFSSIPAVHSAMYLNTQKINKHWDVYMRTDIPIVDAEGAAITLATAKTWKNANGYNKPNETTYFPLAKGTDGKIYHLSTLATANLQALLAEQDGIPYKTPSNTSCEIIESLYMGEDSVGRVFDDSLINEMLNQHGIASAAYVGGRWAIWGAHSADYSQENKDAINVSETACMMLYYLSNDFQHRRPRNVDKPMPANDLKMIVSEEQARLDALIGVGALIYGTVQLDADADALSDIIMEGDYAFTFNITTTPIAKSLTAVVNWTDEGYVTYFADFAA